MTGLVVDAAGARVAIHHGRLDQADQDLARARRLRPPATMPGVACGPGRLELTVPTSPGPTWPPPVGSWRGRGAAGGRPDSAPPAQAGQFRSQLDQAGGEVVGAAALTTAELRLVPLLATHRSFPEMGQQLLGSQPTVKTQALSLSRKLGVASPSQPVQQIQETSPLSR